MTSGAIQQGVPAKVVRSRYARVPGWAARRSIRKSVRIWAVTPRSARMTCPFWSIRMFAPCDGVAARHGLLKLLELWFERQGKRDRQMCVRSYVSRILLWIPSPPQDLRSHRCQGTGVCDTGR